MKRLMMFVASSLIPLPHFLPYYPLSPAAAGAAAVEAEVKPNAEAVYALCDVIDAIVENNPDYKEIIASLDNLNTGARHQKLDELRQRNAENPSIEKKIDVFLETTAMKTYQWRFRNVTAEHFRDTFLALPYQKISAPGDLALPFFELVGNSNEVRAWVDSLVTRIDLKRCQNIAMKWLPDQEYRLPEVFFVYDNNAGSFTAGNRAFYNLYSGEARELLAGGGIANFEIEKAEDVIAHELHHVFALPYYQKTRRSHDSWQRTKMDAIIRDLVSEGAAAHCNPPDGFKKMLWEDRQVIEFLLGELNSRFGELMDGTMTEEQFQLWWSSTFYEIPHKLLEEYVERNFPESEIESTVAANVSFRPDLSHALGWWMVSRISVEGAKSEPVKQLVMYPYSLFARYDEVIGGDQPQLRLETRLLSD